MTNGSSLLTEGFSLFLFPSGTSGFSSGKGNLGITGSRVFP